MTEIKCRCGYTEELEWRISAFGLISALIKFKCKKCKVLKEVEIIFSGKKDDEPKIKTTYETNYIG